MKMPSWLHRLTFYAAIVPLMFGADLLIVYQIHIVLTHELAAALALFAMVTSIPIAIYWPQEESK